MQSRILFALFALTILPLPSASAAIVLDQFGTFTTLSYGDCSDNCNILDLTSLTIDPALGGPGALSTVQAPISGPPIGDAGTLQAEATIVGGLATPLLRASAISNAGKFANVQATGAQGYNVVGGVAGQQLNATVNLTGTISNLALNDSTGLTAQVGFLKVEDPLDFQLLTTSTIIALLDPNAVQLIQTTDGAVTLSGMATLTVDPGDQFYLVALLGASAGGIGAQAISLSTLTVTFDAASAAVIAPAAVPLPAAIFLLLPAVGLLGIRTKS